MIVVLGWLFRLVGRIVRAVVAFVAALVIVTALVVAGTVFVPDFGGDVVPAPPSPEGGNGTETPPPNETPTDRSDAESERAGDPGATSYETDDGTTVESAAVERAVRERVNEIREEQGAGTLANDEAVASVSRAHSADMHARGYVSHVTPEGDGPFDRYRDREDGDRCRAYGENIAVTYLDRSVQTDDGVERYGTAEEVAEGLVKGWMNSEGHRENLLRAGWTHDGVGVYLADDGTVYATHNFCERAD